MNSVKTNSQKRVIAVVGMAGSGKTESVDYLVEKYRWPKVYFGAITFEEIKKRNWEVTPENERIIREELRKEYGMDVYAKLSFSKIRESLKNSSVVIVESLYSWAEYKFMKEKLGDTFKVLAIFASPSIRFARLKQRKIRPILEFEVFQKRDWSEIEKVDKGGPIALADFLIINEGSLKDLHWQLDQIAKEKFY